MSKRKKITAPAGRITFRDRILELRRVRASTLRQNPKNWRTHPQAQHDALIGALNEIGYADALLARQTADGQLELIDGHLRADATPDQEVPVLVLDVSEEEAAKLLLTIDPLAAMAEADKDALGQLLNQVETDSEALAAMFDDMAKQSGIDRFESGGESGGAADQPVEDSWNVVVECRDEADQQALYDRLTGEGYKCRPLTI